MERFGSIKSNKSVNQIQNLCRLCGMNNPGMTLICEDLETDVIDLDDDPSLQRKIEACIGILVTPNDHLPQQCCGICTDKICDFFEFRLMCTSTDIQTRRLLGLPARDERKSYSGTGPRSDFVQPTKIKIEEPVLMEIAPPPDVVNDSRKNTKKKKTSYEPIIQLKKIKLENEEISCSVCNEKFVSEEDKYAHMYATHIPNFAKYGCSSCGNAFGQTEWKSHRNWHERHKKPYICFRCGESHDKYATFSKHIQNNKCSDPPKISQFDIQCDLCRRKYATRNLYEWHACFIKNKTNCRKCGQYFPAKQKLFTHFLKCPLPFIDIPSTKPTTEKPNTRTRKPETSSSIKTEDDLDISTLLETNIHETNEKSSDSLTKMNDLLDSVNDAIEKISEEKAKNKKKSKKKVTPLKIRVKPDPDASVSKKNENDDEITHIPPEEHFADVGSDSDDDTTSQTTTTETSGNATPATFKIKQEKLDTAYGDHVREKDENAETLQDVIRNIKKEPGTHTQEELAAVIISHAEKTKKAINPLAALKKKKKKKLDESRQQLILRIKKEKNTEKSHEETVHTSPIKIALNPLAAAVATKRKKSKLLKIPAQLALKIKKEKAAKRKASENMPQIRIKQEKPDSDEEHHEGPIETDYLGINPLSLLKQKKKNTENGADKNPEPKSTEDASAEKTSKDPIPNIFGMKTTGFMKLSMNSTGLEFPKSDKSPSPITMPIIAEVTGGEENVRESLGTNDDEEKKCEEEVIPEKDEISLTLDLSSNKIETDETPVVPKKIGGFMKLSGMMGGPSGLQFPVTSSAPESDVPSSQSLSQNSNVSIVSEIESPNNKSESIANESTNVPLPPVIPNLGSSCGFKKLSAFSLPMTLNETSPSFPPANVTTDNVQMPMISNVSTGISSFDLDDLISSPPHDATDIDMESLLNEKLMEDDKLGGTDDFLKEIDEQLASGS